jgi:hypothetical protein
MQRGGGGTRTLVCTALRALSGVMMRGRFGDVSARPVQFGAAMVTPFRIFVARTRRALPLAAATLALVACSKDGAPVAPPVVPGPSAEEMPASVAVAASNVVVGFERGRLRQSVAVDAFRMTKHPITVAQYRACVTKGACAVPSVRTGACVGADSRGPLDRATYALEGSDALPVTCASVDEAAKYCAWIGGVLPTSDQWMLAARGPKVARFAWGDGDPTCERHVEADPTCAKVRWSLAADTLDSFAVGKHPGGASPTGVEDVLLVPGELIAASSDAYFGSCASPNAACTVYGTRPGAIDSVEPVRDRVARDDAFGTTSTFRCVMTEAK